MKTVLTAAGSRCGENMVRCPKCGKKIEYLRNFQSGENAYDYNGEEYDTPDFYPSGDVNDYECPLCSEVLFTDEDKAREFLLGK